MELKYVQLSLVSDFFLVLQEISDTDGDKVDSLCEMLKENRITCIQLVIYELEWTIDQCVKLLNTVKAAEVDLNSADSNRYEAVFQVKGLVGFNPFPLILFLERGRTKSQG